jgi:acetyltransferase-like isoleucine patch superfamily enzyme
MSFIHGNTPPWQQARFHLGTFRARHLLAEVGTQSMIDSSVQFIDPGRIRIGRAVEILRNSTLDGRSPEPSALVIGNSARLKENVWLGAYGGHIRVGDHCLIGRNCVFQGHGGTDVGTSCGFGPGCVVVSFDVVYWDEGVPLLHQGFLKEPTRIDDDVRVGANVTILGGVHIASDVVSEPAPSSPKISSLAGSMRATQRASSGGSKKECGAESSLTILLNVVFHGGCRMTKPRIDSVHVTDRSVGGITYESQRIAQGLSSREATKDGAFMEPSGRNRWQSVANGAARNVAQTSENRCCGLRRVA